MIAVHPVSKSSARAASRGARLPLSERLTESMARKCVTPRAPERLPSLQPARLLDSHVPEPFAVTLTLTAAVLTAETLRAAHCVRPSQAAAARAAGHGRAWAPRAAAPSPARGESNGDAAAALPEAARVLQALLLDAVGDADVLAALSDLTPAPLPTLAELRGLPSVAPCALQEADAATADAVLLKRAARHPEVAAFCEFVLESIVAGLVQESADGAWSEEVQQ